MSSYFSTIPKEVVSLVLLNFDSIEELQVLYTYEGFKEVLTSAYFWITKTQSLLEGVNLSFISSDLLKFKSSFVVDIINYITLIESYDVLQNWVSNWDYIISHSGEDEDDPGYTYLAFDLKSVLSPEVLGIDKLSQEDVEMLIKYYQLKGYSPDTNVLILKLLGGGACDIMINMKVLNVKVEYRMNRTDTINILTYLAFNGIREIAF
jgi:hypothetical protein